MEWNEVEKLAMWVLRKKFNITDINEFIGEGFLCYHNCVQKYDPSRSNFASYFRTCFEGHMKDYFRYNSRLIHVPVIKAEQGVETYAVAIDTPIGATKDDGSAITWLDVLEGSSETENAEEKEQAMWLSLVDDIYGKLTPCERKCVPYIKRTILGDGDSVQPKALRTAMWSLRQKLLNAKKLLDNDC